MLDAEFSSSPERASRSGEIVSQDEREVTAGLYPDQLGLFLWRLVPHIKEDFAGDQIHRLIRVADSMILAETREIPLMVTFRGRRVPFNVRIYKYTTEKLPDGSGPEALAFSVKTATALASLFERELKIFFSPPLSDEEGGDEQADRIYTRQENA